MPSAKDINLFETKDYGFSKKPSNISKKEWAQDKLMHYENSLAAAKTFKFNAEQNKIAQDFNKAEAQAARDWQERMSNTSHQRQVKDLKAAGLNPVLSSNSGAQSYTTSAASIAGASGKADSDASAIASYGGSYLSSQAQRYSAKMSAAAMKYSADQALAAAQTQAYASMYNTKAQIAYGFSKDFLDRFHDSWKTSFNAKNQYRIAKEDREEQTKRQQYSVDNGSLYGTINKAMDNLNKAFSGEKRENLDAFGSGFLFKGVEKLLELGKKFGSDSKLSKEKIWQFSNTTNRDKAFELTNKLGLGRDPTAAKYVLAILNGNKKAYLDFRKYIYCKYEK